jgi:hypothetical protein
VRGNGSAVGRVGVGIIPQGSVGRRRGIGRDYVVGRGHAGSPGSGGASSVTPLRQNAHPPTRFPSGRGVRFSEDKELHEDKGDQGRWRNCEKLGDQNVVRDRGEAEMDDRDRRQPTGEDDREVLHELPAVITPPALKYPEFVQHKMAGHSEKVGN